MKINGKTVAPAYVNNKQVVTGEILKLGNDGLKPGVNKEGQKKQTPGLIKTGSGHDNSGYIKTGARKLEPAINTKKESTILKDDDKDRSKLPMSDLNGAKKSDDKVPGHTEVKGDIAAGKRENPSVVDKDGKDQITATVKPLSDLTPEQHETAKALGMSDETAKIALADFDDAAKDQAHAAWAAQTKRAYGSPEVKQQQAAADFRQSMEPRITHNNTPTQVASNGTESVQPATPQVATAPVPLTPPAPTATPNPTSTMSQASEGADAEQGLGMCDAVKAMTDDEKSTARGLSLSDCAAMNDSPTCADMKANGKCPKGKDAQKAENK